MALMDTYAIMDFYIHKTIDRPATIKCSTVLELYLVFPEFCQLLVFFYFEHIYTYVPLLQSAFHN